MAVRPDRVRLLFYREARPIWPSRLPCFPERPRCGNAARAGQLEVRPPAAPATRAYRDDRPNRCSRQKTCRINAARSPRVNVPSDQLAPDGRLPGTAAPILDTQGEER